MFFVDCRRVMPWEISKCDFHRYKGQEVGKCVVFLDHRVDLSPYEYVIFEGISSEDFDIRMLAHFFMSCAPSDVVYFVTDSEKFKNAVKTFNVVVLTFAEFLDRSRFNATLDYVKSEIERRQICLTIILENTVRMKGFWLPVKMIDFLDKKNLGYCNAVRRGSNVLRNGTHCRVCMNAANSHGIVCILEFYEVAKKYVEFYGPIKIASFLKLNVAKFTNKKYYEKLLRNAPLALENGIRLREDWITSMYHSKPMCNDFKSDKEIIEYFGFVSETTVVYKGYKVTVIDVPYRSSFYDPCVMVKFENGDILSMSVFAPVRPVK